MVQMNGKQTTLVIEANGGCHQELWGPRHSRLTDALKDVSWGQGPDRLRCSQDDTERVHWIAQQLSMHPSSDGTHP